MNPLWLAAGLLLLVAAAGLFTAFRAPAFVASMGRIMIKAALDTFVPKLVQGAVRAAGAATKRMSPEDEAKWRRARKANRPAPYRHRGGSNPHPDEKD